MLRLRVVAALESGRVESYRQATGVFGVSERSVGTWWRAYLREGCEGLAVRQGRRPGPAELIGDEERGTLFAAMADYTPEELLIGGPLWTRQAVVEPIRLVVGVVMTEQGVGLWLRRHGLTPQRPARNTYGQRPAAVRAWLDEQYPAIETRAKAEGAVIAWVDQCGLRPDAAGPGRSRATKGRTPVVRVTGKRLRVNVMSAVAPRGALWFTVFTGRFTAPVFTTFLDRVARQAGRKVHVIADRHPVHRSKAARTWLEANVNPVELHLMPAYSPEPNPDELLNTASNATSTPPAHTADRLAQRTRRFLHRRRPHIVLGYFQTRHVRYAIV
ncbi:IS630 family transposase [Saccharothrix luteola]|uniref:IS630 family transposase n=1 Tax=Saccharothrix luteola TaxID=2893018 RepID=UPI001E548817|nr:IS630 family transposase [Saccharothrix luteola]